MQQVHVDAPHEQVVHAHLMSGTSRLSSSSICSSSASGSPGLVSLGSVISPPWLSVERLAGGARLQFRNRDALVAPAGRPVDRWSTLVRSGSTPRRGRDLAAGLRAA